MGIENTTGRNFKELEGMLGNAKALKRNNWESRGILIGPSMAPRFSRCRDSVAVFFLAARKSPSASEQISRRGWQADDLTFPINAEVYYRLSH